MEVGQLLLSQKTIVTNMFEGESVARIKCHFQKFIRDIETAAEAIKEKARDRVNTAEVCAVSWWSGENALQLDLLHHLESTDLKLVQNSEDKESLEQ